MATRSPAPKSGYKLAWFERLIEYAQDLIDSGHPIVLAGDYNVVPTDHDIYNPRAWLDNALLQPESRECFGRLVDQVDRRTSPHARRRAYLHLLGLSQTTP
jgi:exodeoxyribonuclease-3